MKDSRHPQQDRSSDLQTPSPMGASRRAFLRIGAGTSMATAAVTGLVPSKAKAERFSSNSTEPSLGGRTRAASVRDLRADRAQELHDQTVALADQLCNEDEARYRSERYYASFSKTLPCNDYGEVDPASFERLTRALRTGAEADFRAINLSFAAERGLANPQAAFKMELSGLDSHATRIAPAHAFRSAELAGEMIEVYWMAIARDIPFARWPVDRRIERACTQLSQLSATPGPMQDSEVTPNTLFRGASAGDLAGPYLSQFLWQPFRFGQAEIEQRYRRPASRQHFMRDHQDWLHIQRGGEPTAQTRLGSPRYICTLRALAEYVHQDLSFQAYLNAALVLIGFGSEAFSSQNPYATLENREGFVTFGEPYALEMVTRAANLAFTGAWFQKWRVHRFLRPEALGARVHFMRQGQRSYELHDELLNAPVLDDAQRTWGSHFLAQAFPEGSPTHPSYPAGHACVAGACVTALKAIFNEDFVIPNPVVASISGSRLLGYSGNELRVGDELNKLASNIAFGRNAGGVHYRQDGVQGLILGEQQAISLLVDQSLTLNESTFEGFRFTKFDGTRIEIRDGVVRPL